jgi:molecular chaperone DnaJ
MKHTMASKPDYYEVLGIHRTASSEEISTAYRKQAMKYHPDRNPGDDGAIEKFKLSAEAFEVLSDDGKRQLYDQYGHAGLESQGGGASFHDVGDIFDAFGDIFGESLFGSFFGGGRRRGGRRVRRGGDIKAEVVLDLFEAARGVSKVIHFKRHDLCSTCNGSGAKPGTARDTCQYCRGHGRIQQSTGIFSIQTTCPQCQGQGSIVQDPCNDCNGMGLVAHQVEREVKIPAGVDNGTRLRLQGEGEKSPDGGPSGDCYIFITVKSHPLFQREGQDLICRVPIGYAQAALGTDIEVPTLDGPEEIKIPAGIQSGDVITLKGRGMPVPRRNLAGDLLIQVYIEVPRKLKPEHEAVLRELAKIEKEHVSKERKSFFSKLKEYVSEKIFE